MAQVEGSGISEPVALPYLISEGLLSENPEPDAFHCETYVSQEGDDQIREEILTTKRCVVWSRAQSIHNVYRFDVEGEDVVQAVLTRFPTITRTTSQRFHGTIDRPRRQTPDHGYGSQGRWRQDQKTTRSTSLATSRALVVFLKSKVHIYFLRGSTYILDLPIEIERAFPAPCGVILQRRRSPLQSLPGTPRLPPPPPTSFLSSHVHHSASLLASPTIAKSFRGTSTAQLGPLSDHSRLDGIVSDGSTQSPREDLAPLYSLVDPLSDFGVITYSLQHAKPRFSGKRQAGVAVEFEPLDASEHVVYVSAEDELATSSHERQAALMLIVTTNDDLRTLTVWHAWRIDEQSLALQTKRRAAEKAAGVRRRSSFLSTSLATGASTPGVRQREGTRESFATAGSVRPLGEPIAPQQAAVASRKPTQQEDEEVMASQMDPDYAASQQNARESRRISSLNTDARAGHGSAINAIGAAGARWNASSGGNHERRSFGPRKSRGSTPGGVFSRSLRLEDDAMDIDDSFDGDGEEHVKAVVTHIRATFETAGVQNICGGADGDLDKEIVVRKLYSHHLALDDSKTASAASPIQVLTLGDTQPLPDSTDQRLNVYINDRARKSLTCVHLVVKHRSLWQDSSSDYVAVPFVRRESTLESCSGITKLRDRDTVALVLAGKGIILSPDDHSPVPVPTITATRAAVVGVAEDVWAQRQAEDRMQEDGTPHARLLYHQRAKLLPDDCRIDELLRTCRLLLPQTDTHMVLRLWHAVSLRLHNNPHAVGGTAVPMEWVAFAATVFALVAHLLEDGLKSSLKLPRTDGLDQHNQFLQHHDKDALSSQTAWQWIDDGPYVAKYEEAGHRDGFPMIAAVVALQVAPSAHGDSPEPFLISRSEAVSLMLGLHVFNEEQKLSTLHASSLQSTTLAVIIAQLGEWLHLPSWSYSVGSYYEKEGASQEKWQFVTSNVAPSHVSVPLMAQPLGIFQWFEHALETRSRERYPTVDILSTLHQPHVALSKHYREECEIRTPRIAILSHALEATRGLTVDPVTTVQAMAMCGITAEILQDLPSAVAAPFREALVRCEKEPPTTWPPELLSLVGRKDLDIDPAERPHTPIASAGGTASGTRDVQTVCIALDQHSHNLKTKEADRHAVSQLIFSEDRRLVDITSLMHFNSPQVAECPRQQDWTDAHHLEQQRKLMQWVTIRTIALPAGDAMIHFDSQRPLLTDRYHLAGFSSSCLMQPMGHTMTTDRSGLTEERVNWAYFHAGASAGLRISRTIEGIDTSWIAFNKPNDLTNRHAGLLLALGLNGHLRNLAKWLSFKYLTPKHTMTSVGLLLGLSASYMGTMDGLVTRMLSVHVTRLLPPGAAELNVSPITQTAGLMGIGLLYYNTQHRRMSEIMLSEVEHMELEDPDSGPDPLRDESYRLAAGLALGLINLGKGRDLRGLRGMHLPERLLAIAVGPRPVNAVHIFDRATAGAVVAVALVYMKSGDKAMAHKIDIPDTEAQFDHVRPDVLLLRAMAKHVVLWESIQVSTTPTDSSGWIHANLPWCYRSRFQQIKAQGNHYGLKSSDVAFYSIATGLAWAISLKYAGTGNVHARDEVLAVLSHFHTVLGRSGTQGYARAANYDTKLTKSTLRRCIDVLAVAAATIMAGTGDLESLRHLRRLHGRTDPDTSYGSHFAAHLAIGVLFLGGGTYTFGTSDLAIASLISAFYPLYPTDVHDNHVHLQAFRHLWVFAAEARCLVVEDVDTQKPIVMPILVARTDGSMQVMTSPCLLPELDGIASVQTNDPSYWRVTLDFAGNPAHLAAFRTNQRISVRRCPASEAHSSVFSATLSTLDDSSQAISTSNASPRGWRDVFKLPVFKNFERADLELVLPPDVHSSIYTDERGTVVDDCLQLGKGVEGVGRDELWNLRLLFAWAERARDAGEGRVKWIGGELVEALKARIEERQT